MAVVVALLVGVISPAMATHLRGALGETTYDPVTKKVDITSILLQAKTWTSADTFFAFPTIYRIDRVTGASTVVKPCTGQSTSATFTESDTTAQPLFDINTTKFSIDVSCSSFPTSFDYAFSQTAGNRINGIRNSTNQTIQVESRIRIDGVNAAKAPVYNAGLMTNVTYDATAGQYFSASLNALAGGLTGTVPVNDAVTYSLITDQSSSSLGAYGAGRIPCSDFNTSTGILRIGSSLCTGTESYATAFSGGTDAAPVYYAFKTRAMDAAGQYMTRDVLLAFSTTTNTRPTLTFSPTGQTKTIANPVGDGSSTAIDVTFTANDVDAAQTLDFAHNNFPSYVTLTNTSTSTASPTGTSLTGTLHIAPPAGTNGVLQLVISAYDKSSASNFFSLSASQQIDVQIGSGILPPSSPGKPVVSSVGASYSSGGVNKVDVTFSFTAPSGGGAADCYTVKAVSTDGTSTLDSVTSPSSPCTGNDLTLTRTIAGLLAGKTYVIIATAHNSAGSADSQPSDNTGLAAPNISLSKNTIALQRNVAIGASGYTVSNSGGALNGSNPYTISAALPAGLAFSQSTGLISGTPTADSSSTAYTITATGPGGTSSASFVLSVGLKTQTINFNQPWGVAIPTSGTAYQKLYSNATSGVTVTYAVDASSSSVCALKPSSTDIIQITSSATAGACSVTASAASSNGYAAAISVTKTFYVFTASTKPSATSCVSGSSTTWTQPPVLYLVTSAYTYSTPSTFVPTNSLSSFVIGTAVSNTTRIINAGAPGAKFDSAGIPQAPCNTNLTFSTTSAPSGSPAFNVTGSTGTTASWTNFGDLAGTPNAKSARGTATITARASASGMSLTGTALISLETVGKSQTLSFTQPTDMLLSAGSQSLVASTTATSTTNVQKSISGKSMSGSTARLYFVAPNPYAVGNTVTVANGGSSIRSSSNCSGTSSKAYWSTSSGSSVSITAIGSDANGSYIEYTSPSTSCTQSYTTQSSGTITRADSVAMPISLVSNTPAVCTVGSATASFVAAGTCQITASQAGDSTYAAATPITRSFTIIGAPQLSLTSPVTQMTAGTFVSSAYALSVTGSPATSYSISPSTMPDGLVFDPTTGLISGTPEAGAGSRTFYITATNSAGSSNTVSYTFTVAKKTQSLRFDQPASMVLPASTTTQALTAIADSGLVATVAIDPTSTSVCHIDTDGITVIADDVGTCALTASQPGTDAFSAATPVARSFVVFDVADLIAPNLEFDDGSASTTVTVEKGRPAAFTFAVVNTGGPVPTQGYSIAPALPTGFAFNKDTGEITQTDFTKSLSAGTYEISAVNTAGTSNSITVHIIVQKRDQTITLQNPGTHNASDADFAPSGSSTSGLTVAYSVSPVSVCTLVAGSIHLKKAGGTCVITATQDGDDTYNAAASLTTSFTVVGPPAINLSNSTLLLYAGEAIASPYTVTQSSDVASLFTISPSLPSGISFDAATGLISGTPTAVQSQTTYTLTGIGSGGSGIATFTIEIVQRSQTITFPTPNAMAVSSTQPLGAVVDSGKTVVYTTKTPTICTVSGSLVTSLAIAGTCTVQADSPGDVTYTAAAAKTVSFTVYTTLPAPALSISAASATVTVNKDAGTPYTLTNTGGVAASYSISPAVPENMSFDTTTGLISGTPQTAASARTYTITATNSTGTSQATIALTVAKGDATVSFDASSLTATYDGTAKSAVYSSVNTNDTYVALDSSLRDGSTATVSFTYDGQATAPTDAGSYTVVATISDDNFQGSASATLVINKATASLSMPSSTVVYDGSTHSLSPQASGISSPTFTVTYNGLSGLPSNAGTYAALAVLSNANYSGSISSTLTISPAPVVINVTDLSQQYTGDALAPTVDTDPVGVNYSVTYDGAAEEPVDVGEYSAEVTIDDPNYTGSTTKTFTVTKADQSITWVKAPSNSAVGAADQSFQASATSGLTVSYAVSPSSVCTLVAGKIHMVGAGSCVVTASQSGNGSFNAATDLSATITVAASVAAPILTVDDLVTKSKTITAFTYNTAISNPYLLFNSGGACDSYTSNKTAPAGLTFSRSTGLFSGTPTAVTAKSTYRITCINITGTSYVDLDLEVVKATTTLSLSVPQVSMTYGDADQTITSVSGASLPINISTIDTSIASIVDGKLHAVAPGTTTLKANTAETANYFGVNATDVTITVTAKHLSATGITVTRDRKSGLLSFGDGALDGVVGSDDVTLDISAMAGTPENSGAVTLSVEPSLSGTNKDNYILDSASVTWTWGDYYTQSISWSDGTSFTYGDSDVTLTGTASSGLDVSYVSGDTSVVTIVDGALHILKAGTVTVTAKQAGDAAYSAATDVAHTITIAPKGLTVTSITVLRDRRTQLLGFSGGTLSGVVGSDSVSADVSTTAGTANVDNTVTLTSPVALSGSSKTNYTLTQPSLTWAWGAYETQSITWTQSLTFTYGTSDATLTASASSGLVPTYDPQDVSVATISGNTIHFVAAGQTDVTVSQSGNSIYSAASNVTRRVTVNPKTLTVTGIRVTRDDATGVLTFSGGVLNGIVGTDPVTIDLSGLTGTVDGSGNVTIDPGALASLAGSAASNYILTQPTGLRLTNSVNQAQSISWSDGTSFTYGDADVTLTGSASSGLAVSYVSGDTSVVTIVNGALHILKPGTVTVTAKQAGDATYRAATDVAHTITIAPKRLTLTGITVLRDRRTGALTFSGGSLSGVIGSDSVSADLSGVAGTANVDNTVTLTSPVTLSGSDESNYTLTQPSLTWAWGTYDPQSISWTDGTSFTYGDADVTMTGTASSGLAVSYVSGNSSIVTIVSGALHFVKAGTATVTAKQVGDDTYSPAADVVHTITIAPKALTVTQIRVTRDPVTGNLTFAGGVLNGVVGSDPVTVDLSGLTGTVDANGNVTIDPGALASLTGSAAANYTLTQPTGLTLSGGAKRPQSINSVDSLSLTVGDSLTLRATATSGLPVAYGYARSLLAVQTSAVCSVQGAVVTALTAGDCRVELTQSGNASYLPATPVVLTIPVNLAARSASISPIGSLTVRQNQPLTSSATDGESAPIWLSLTPATCSVSSSGVISPISSGTCSVRVTYPASSRYAEASAEISASVTRAIPTITISAPTTSLQVGGTATIKFTGPVTQGYLSITTGEANCSVSGFVLTALAAGSCTIVGTTEQTGSYESITTAPFTFIITLPQGIPAPTLPVDPEVQSASLFGPTTGDGSGSGATSDVAQRSVDQLANEQIGGFTPGSSVRVDVIGAKTSATFIVPPTGYIDISSIREALTNSANDTDFVRVDQAESTTSPNTNGIRISAISPDDMDVFNTIGLSSPRLLTQIDAPTVSNWVRFGLSVSSYRPGSTIYLVMTSSPIVFATAVVGDDGKAKITGDLPMSLLGEGVHKLRVVGNRNVGMASVGADGTITLSDEALAQVQRFDNGTNVTLRVVGPGQNGSSTTAVRIIPLTPYVPWWLMWILIGAGLLLLLTRLFGVVDRFLLSWIKRAIYLLGGVGVGLVGLLVESVAFAVTASIVTIAMLALSFLPRYFAHLIPRRVRDEELDVATDTGSTLKVQPSR